MGSEVISIQDGSGMLTSSIKRARAHGVGTKVGRLRKHSVLIGFQLFCQHYKMRILRA